jgi:UDP-GlcNAc:undecaprenyl-phosphate GlcNAc-1-phosphate transferase
MPGNLALLSLILLVALAVSLAICLDANQIGQFLGVMDVPDHVRKRHAKATPLVGGIAIMAAVTVWASIRLMTGQAVSPPMMIAIQLCGAGVAAVGFADDKQRMSPLSRIILLIVFLAIAVAIDPQLIAAKLYWGSFAPTPIAPWFYAILMAVTAVGLVNAVNMADGQNGVVISMFIVWSGCLLLIDCPAVVGIAGTIFLISFVVLGFNLAGKLFLGDCGTYGVTFAIGLLAAMAHAQGAVSLETIIVWFFIPVADCIRLLITRPLRGRSPFNGDRDHFHHRLEVKLGKKLGLVTYAGAVAAFSLSATLMPHFALVCLIGLSAFYLSFAWLPDRQSISVAPKEVASPKDESGIVVMLNRGAQDGKRHIAI